MVNHDGYLAIDTSLGTSIALMRGSIERIAEARDERGHTEKIGSLIEQVLGSTTPGDLSGIVVGVGPGPFTGLRVGIAAAQAFALGIDRSLLPVVSHDAVALEHLTRGYERVRVIQDAKRRELFVTEYDGLDEYGIPRRVSEPHIQPRTNFTDHPGDVWHERVPALELIRIAAARIQAGIPAERPQALYLRAPDVAQPGPVKRVSS